MRNYGKKKNYCLIAALASLVAFSTMAASVMSGCGENSDEQKTTEIVHETRIDTQIETKIETYTEVVTDAQGKTEYVEETKAVPVNNNAGGNSKSGDSGNNSENSGGSSSGKNQTVNRVPLLKRVKQAKLLTTVLQKQTRAKQITTRIIITTVIRIITTAITTATKIITVHLQSRIHQNLMTATASHLKSAAKHSMLVTQLYAHTN